MKKVKIIVLIASILMSLSTVNAKTEETVELKPKTNIEFISGDYTDLNVDYILTNEEGKFRIIESSSPDYNYVKSKVLKENEDGEFVEYREYEMIIQDGIATLITSGPNTIKTTKEVMDLNVSGAKIRTFTESVDILGNASNWVYDGYVDGNNKIVSYTVRIVTNLITKIAIPVVAEVSAEVKDIIAEIVADIIADMVETVYYRQHYYEKRALDVSWYMAVGSKWETEFYADARHMMYLNTTIEEVYLDGYES